MKLELNGIYLKLTIGTYPYYLQKHEGEWYFIVHDIGGADLMKLQERYIDFVDIEYKKIMRKKKLERINE